MDIQFNKVNPKHGVISIELHESDYKSIVEKQIRLYAQKVRLKGFRLGAVPIDLVKRMYGVSILSEELHKLAATALQEYIQKESILIFIEPLLVDIPNEKDLKNKAKFNFTYEVGLIEDFPIDLGPHISISKFEIDGRVDDKLMNEFLEGLQIVHGVSVDMGESREDSILNGSIEDSVSKETTELRIVIDRLPEHLRKAFIGQRVGAEVMLTKEMIENHTAPLLGIMFGLFTYFKNKGTFPYVFKIKKISSVTPISITTELFDLVLGKGVVSSEEEFREAMAKVILFDKRSEVDNAFNDDLRNTFLKKFPINLPDVFLKKWLLLNNTETAQEEIDLYYEEYQEKLKWEILLGMVVRTNNLAVTQMDVIEEGKRIYLNYLREHLSDSKVSNYDESDITEVALDFLKKDEGKNYAKIHERLSKDRAIDFIKKHISVIIEVVTIETFDQNRFC